MMDRPCKEDPAGCPQEVNRPLHPAEREALSIAGCGGAWRPPNHPRMKDRRPSLDWASVRNIHDPEAAPWSQVRVMLIALEMGARRAKSEEEPSE